MLIIVEGPATTSQHVVDLEDLPDVIGARISIAECAWCGIPFVKKTSFAVYHSDHCRKTAHRKQVRNARGAV